MKLFSYKDCMDVLLVWPKGQSYPQILAYDTRLGTKRIHEVLGGSVKEESFEMGYMMGEIPDTWRAQPLGTYCPDTMKTLPCGDSLKERWAGWEASVFVPVHHGSPEDRAVDMGWPVIVVGVDNETPFVLVEYNHFAAWIGNGMFTTYADWLTFRLEYYSWKTCLSEERQVRIPVIGSVNRERAYMVARTMCAKSENISTMIPAEMITESDPFYKELGLLAIVNGQNTHAYLIDGHGGVIDGIIPADKINDIDVLQQAMPRVCWLRPDVALIESTCTPGSKFLLKRPGYKIEIPDRQAAWLVHMYMSWGHLNEVFRSLLMLLGNVDGFWIEDLPDVWAGSERSLFGRDHGWCDLIEGIMIAWSKGNVYGEALLDTLKRKK